ncbi:MAG TPA: PAS domain-containing sensor histidine kinase [Desulfurivibrio alkaliphilus]|uniref:histidine kinase n=1 Tax=Desulfurivibrio alkaliphilus TaxID=427923 RepID=A0A7C2TJE6_9BACT|nr:PAS domain-containing sensor histidine kinase [Desulfurivibrio alkaliphilus]
MPEGCKEAPRDLWQTVLDGVADPIIVVGADYYIKLMNRAAREYSRCGDRDVARWPHCHQLIFGLERPCDQAGRSCPLQEVLRSRRRVQVEHEHYTAAGELRVFEVLASPLFDDDGRVWGIVESLRDVTTRKRMAIMLRDEQERLERRVRERTAQLLHAKEKAELLYRMSPSAIFTVDGQGLVSSWNDRAEEATGYQRWEVMGRPCPLFADLDLADCAGVEAGEALLARIGRLSGSECQVTLKDGRLRLLRVDTGLLRHPDGEVVGAIGSFEDVTEEKLRAAETMRAGQLAAIGELAAGVAHEINNPINGIINFAQLLVDDSPGGEGGEMLVRIIEEGERIADIVRNLLSFSRQHRTEDVEPVMIGEVIDNALALYTHQMFKDGITLSVDLDEGLPLLSVNPQQLQQVFLNLLSNARHALNQRYPGKDPDKRLDIRARPWSENGNSYVRTTVTDHGTGIPREIIEHIFEPFFSSKKMGEGTGLGLSISQGIMRELGGFLRVESEYGKHTTMMVDLPVS